MAQVKAMIDKLLTNVSNGIFPMGYIAESLFPELNVVQQSGKIGKYGKDHLRIVNTVMGGRGKAPRLESITRSDSSYYIDDHGLEGLVTEQDYRNVEEPFDAEKDEVTGLTTVLWLGKEKALADALGDTAVLTQNTTLSGTAQFSDYANSDPLTKFKDARLAIRNGCGLPPNVAWMDWGVANTLAYHPAILDALGFTQNRAGQLSDQELAKAMGVERLYIAKAVYNSAKEGQTDAVGAVWGKHIGFGYLPTAAGKYQQSLGYRVKYQGKKPRQVFKKDEFNPPNSTLILVHDQYDMLITDVTAGYLIKDTIA